MKSCTYLLVGGGLASARAAKQLRRFDPEGSIILASSEPHPPYDRPPLSKEYLRGEKSSAEIFLEKPEVYRESGIVLALGRTVSRLDLDAKVAYLEDGEQITFQKLLLATGGRVRRLALPGAGLEEVYYLRTMDDSDAIRRKAVPGKRAVIIGAGFIGLEMAASLTQMGVQVTVIEVAPYIWSRFTDATTASFFQEYYEERGITFLTGESVREFQGRDRVSAVTVASGKEIPCDFVCVGVGIMPNTELAEAAGLKVTNGVRVNEYLETSHPNVYAAGDIVNYYDPIFEKRRRVEHWGHAEYTGLLAGENMTGAGKPYDLLTYVFSDIFDLRIEFAGDETDYDKTITRGDFQGTSFTILYLKEDTLRAYLAVNVSPREFIPLQRLIRRKVDLASHSTRLQDRDYDLRGLVPR